MKKRIYLAICTAGLLTIHGAAFGQKIPTTTGAGMMSAADKQFAMEALQGGTAEVKLGQLAAQKGSSDGIKAFGQRMVTDHTKAGNELKEIASAKGIPIPEGIGTKHQAAYDKLSGLSGASFDSEYIRHMVADHRQDLSAFQKEANQGQDADIRAFASKTLPMIQDHLRQAQELQGRNK